MDASRNEQGPMTMYDDDDTLPPAGPMARPRVTSILFWLLGIIAFLSIASGLFMLLEIVVGNNNSPPGVAVFILLLGILPALIAHGLYIAFLED